VYEPVQCDILTSISGFRRDVDQICALLGYYHTTPRNIPEKRRSDGYWAKISLLIKTLPQNVQVHIIIINSYKKFLKTFDLRSLKNWEHVSAYPKKRASLISNNYTIAPTSASQENPYVLSVMRALRGEEVRGGGEKRKLLLWTI
jgi:hypothetical protein